MNGVLTRESTPLVCDNWGDNFRRPRLALRTPGPRDLALHEGRTDMVEVYPPARDTTGQAQPLAAALDAFRGVLESDKYLKPMWGPRKKRTQLPDGLRRSVLRRDRFTCCECSVSWSPNRDLRLEVDHVIPHAAGGTDRTDNLRTLCEFCNEAKSNLYTFDVACYRPRLIVAYCYTCQPAEDVKEGVTHRVFCATCKRSAAMRPDHAEERELAKALGRA